MSITAARLGEFFKVGGDAVASSFQPSYNVAPGQTVWGCLDDDGGRRLEPFSWGFVPPWARVPEFKSRLINARSESAATKTVFRAAFQKRRCLVPADAFYEWKPMGSGKQPYCIAMTDREPFAIAGIWGTWVDVAGGQLRSCALLTTAANGVVSDLHERMPVILPESAWDRWLSPASDLDELQFLMRPFPDEGMQAWPVGRGVNSVANDSAALQEPLRTS